jgi:hypothetical protein
MMRQMMTLHIPFFLPLSTKSLSNKIEERLDDDDPFFVVWLEFIKAIQSTSVEPL